MSTIDHHAQMAKNLPMRGNMTSGMDRIWNVPRCRIICTAAQSFTNNVAATVTFDSPNSATLGFDTDGTDGRVGRDTQRAVRDFQKKFGLSPADGYAGLKVLTRLRQAS